MIIEIMILVGILMLYIFTKKYRSKEICRLKKKENPLIFFYPAAYKIIDLVWPILKSSSIQKDGINKNDNSIMENRYRNAPKLAIVIFMSIVATLLLLLATVIEAKNIEIGNNVINRPDYVENSQNIDVNVYKSGEDTPFAIGINIAAKQFTIEEVEQNFEIAYEYLLKNILKDNQSLQSITGDLNLVSEIKKYAINVEWRSSDYNVVDFDGKVLNSEFENKNIQVVPIELTAVMSYGEYECEYPIEINVLPQPISDNNRFVKNVEIAIANVMENSIYDDVVKLPDEVDGVSLEYRMVKTGGTATIVLLSISATIALLCGTEIQKKKDRDYRKKQLKYDYSEVVSKLTLLLGAGMTISRAWEKIALDYQHKRACNQGKKHFVYEEMLISYYHMKSGLAEIKAYGEFGKRCESKEYIKLGALLEQNIKKGTKGLAQMLEKESLEAFEERKNMARQLGEEAGTKLLIPMGIMLVVVMIIVTVPAFMSFGI